MGSPWHREGRAGGLRFYDNLFDELHKYGIEPVVTITHYETPLYLCQAYGGWQSREMIGFYEKFARTVLERYKDKVRFWMSFNEINVISMMPELGGGFHVEMDNPCRSQMIYQAAHHQFVAAARAVKLCHEIVPDGKMGMMLASQLSYPATCAPEDVLANMQQGRVSLFFADVMLRGHYPAYGTRFFRENGIELKLAEGDLDTIARYTSDYLALSYYMSNVVSKDFGIIQAPTRSYNKHFIELEAQTSPWSFWASNALTSSFAYQRITPSTVRAC